MCFFLSFFPRHWDQCKTPLLWVAMAFDPAFHGEAYWSKPGMAAHILQVISKLMLVDTEPEDVEEKMGKAMLEANVYYIKSGIFALPSVWVAGETQAPFLWWEQYGCNDMPNLAKYIVMLEGIVVNQTSSERFLKGFKHVNSKFRTNMGGLTAAQYLSEEDETTTRGIITAEVYLRTSMTGWCDPSCSLTVDDEVYTISELDKKEWALLFEPRVVQPEPDLAERTVLLKIESWEQPTKQCKEVYFKLLRKYVKLVVEDEEDDEDEEGDAAAAVAPTLVKRKIDSIVWQKGKGNSYVARACDLTQDGKMDRTKLTDYKLEATLVDLISAGTTAGFNQGVNFINMDVAEVAAVAPTAAPAGLAAPALVGATEEADPALEADTLAARRATAEIIPVGAGGGPWQAEPQQDGALTAAATAPLTEGLCGGGAAGGCGNAVGDVHKCPHCQVSMHPFCGLGVGDEGFGQPVICKVCQQTNGVPAGNAAGEGNAMDEDAAPAPPPRRAVRAASAGVNSAVAAVRGGRLAH